MRTLKAWKMVFIITIPSFFVYIIAISDSIDLDSIFGSSGFYLELKGYKKIIAAVITFIFSSTFTVLLVNQLFSYYWVRKIFAGRFNIEGYWIIKTVFNKTEKKEHPLYKDGVLFLQYIGNDLKLKAVTSRLDENDQVYIIKSSVAFVSDDPSKIEYLNYFNCFFPNGEIKYGMAHSEFVLPSRGGMLYEGKIVIEEEANLRRQFANRIKDRDVSKLINIYSGDTWIYELLKMNLDVTKILSSNSHKVKLIIFFRQLFKIFGRRNSALL